MPTITAENRDAWQALADSLAAQRPSVGKWVRVNKGRKNLGVEGAVTWHGRDRFTSTRYCTDAQLHFRDMAGRIGFRIGVRPAGGGEVFFVSADNVEVVEVVNGLSVSR